MFVSVCCGECVGLNNFISEPSLDLPPSRPSFLTKPCHEFAFILSLLRERHSICDFAFTLSQDVPCVCV